MTPFLFAVLFSTLLSLGEYLVKGSVQPLYTILYFFLALQRNRWILILLVIITFLEQLFYTYFARPWHYSDYYNFFTHTTETFETFFAFLPLFWKPFTLFALSLFLIYYYTPAAPKTKKHHAHTVFLVFIALLILPQFRPFMEISELSAKTDPVAETPLYPTRHPKTDIIFVIGESMKYNPYVTQKLRQLKPDFFTRIISGATNTDVSVSLLLNAKTNPLHLSTTSKTNLFRLARENGYYTAYISSQSEKSIQYIKPYLQRDKIDFCKNFDRENLAPAYDMNLFETFTRLPYTDKPRFIVLHQIGEHAPYLYYPGAKSDDPVENYKRCVDYSVALYQKLIDHLNTLKRPYILLYTSDHGEFTGENGRRGHNTFAPTIYQVPFFTVTNTRLPKNITRIKTHHDLSRMLIYLLGYGEPPELNTTKTIVNGTMLSREDGYIEVTVE